MLMVAQSHTLGVGHSEELFQDDVTHPLSLWSQLFLLMTSLASMSLLLAMCVCADKTKSNIRVRVRQAENCLKKKGLFHRNDTNNNHNGAKDTMESSNGSLGTSNGSNGKVHSCHVTSTRVLIGQSGCKPERQLSRDRELPPVPTQSSLNDPSFHSLLNTPSPLTPTTPLPTAGQHDGYETMPQDTSLQTSQSGGADTTSGPAICSKQQSDSGFRWPKQSGNGDMPLLRHSKTTPQAGGQYPPHSGHVMAYESISDIQSEVDPLYATVAHMQASSSGHHRGFSRPSSSIHSTPSAPSWRHALRHHSGGMSFRSEPPPSNDTSHPITKVKEPSTPLYARILRIGNGKKVTCVPSRPDNSTNGSKASMSFIGNSRQGQEAGSRDASSLAIDIGDPSMRYESYASITGPPIPSRHYGQSEIDLIDQSRLSNVDGQSSNQKSLNSSHNSNASAVVMRHAASARPSTLIPENSSHRPSSQPLLGHQATYLTRSTLPTLQSVPSRSDSSSGGGGVAGIGTDMTDNQPINDVFAPASAHSESYQPTNHNSYRPQSDHVTTVYGAYNTSDRGRDIAVDGNNGDINNPISMVFSSNTNSSGGGGPYHKVSVRESLASLRARNALPSVMGNNNGTFELVGIPGQPPCPGGYGNQSGHLSQVYEGLYEGLNYYEEISGGSRSHSGSHHRLSHRLARAGLARETREGYYSRAEDSASEAYAEIPDLQHYQASHLSETAFHMIAEMKTFRHMDSDLDLSRVSTPRSGRRSPAHPWYLPRYRPFQPTSFLPAPSPPHLQISHPSHSNQNSPLNNPSYPQTNLIHDQFSLHTSGNRESSRPQITYSHRFPRPGSQQMPSSSSFSHGLVESVNFVTSSIQRPAMTPLMERSMETSYVDENRNTVSSGDYEPLPPGHRHSSTSTFSSQSTLNPSLTSHGHRRPIDQSEQVYSGTSSSCYSSDTPQGAIGGGNYPLSSSCYSSLETIPQTDNNSQFAPSSSTTWQNQRYPHPANYSHRSTAQSSGYVNVPISRSTHRNSYDSRRCTKCGCQANCCYCQTTSARQTSSVAVATVTRPQQQRLGEDDENSRSRTQSETSSIL